MYLSADMAFSIGLFAGCSKGPPAAGTDMNASLLSLDLAPLSQRSLTALLGPAEPVNH